jgi:ribosomal protein L44E
MSKSNGVWQPTYCRSCGNLAKVTIWNGKEGRESAMVCGECWKNERGMGENGKGESGA